MRDDPRTGEQHGLLSPAEADLHAFIDGELDPARATEVAQQIASEPARARRAEAYARQTKQLAAALACASGDPEDPYTAVLADGLARRLDRGGLRWIRRFSAAAGLLAAGWWSHELTRVVTDPIPDELADAAEIHEIFAEDSRYPLELSSAEAGALADWMSQQLGEPVTVPNLSALGLTFVGGRLLGREEGPFAQIVYEGPDGGRVSLYMASPDEDDTAELQVVEIGELNAGRWEEGDLAYTVVDGGSDERLLAIASRLGAEIRL